MTITTRRRGGAPGALLIAFLAPSLALAQSIAPALTTTTREAHMTAIAAAHADPARTPPRFAHQQLATGVRLHYAEAGRATAPVAILLHGYSDSWFSYSGVLDGLAAGGLRVLALDQRGHGESERPAGGYAIPSLADDVLAFMDAMGIERATIVGHSMGSLVAQHVAARAPQRVERLVLVGSAADPRNDVLRELSGAIATFEREAPDDFIREFQSSTITVPVPPAFYERVVAESHKLPVHAWRAIIAAMLAPDAVAPIERITAPTLLLWGTRDGVFGRADQQALQRGIGGAELRVYQDIGHALHWEAPERFVRDVVGFVAPTR